MRGGEGGASRTDTEWVHPPPRTCCSHLPQHTWHDGRMGALGESERDALCAPNGHTHTHTDERGAHAQRGGRACQRGCLVQQRRWCCCSGVREGAREEGIAAAVCWPVVSAWWMVGDRLKCGVEGLSRRAKGFLVGMRTRWRRRRRVTATAWALCGGGENKGVQTRYSDREYL